MNYRNDNLEIEFREHAKIVDAIETIREAIDNGMSIDQVAKALAGTKNAIDLVGKIGDLATKATTLDLQENIIALRNDLIDVKESLLEIKTERLELKEKVFKLEEENKELKNPKIKLTIRDGVYYDKDNDGPFCTGCYDNNKKVIRFNYLAGGFSGCPVCKANVKIKK
jgi:DNA-binding transcriptional MerR regulator